MFVNLQNIYQIIFTPNILAIHLHCSLIFQGELAKDSYYPISSYLHPPGRMDNTPSLATYLHLCPWLQGNISLIDIDFNLNDVPHNNFETQLDLMLDNLESGDLHAYFFFLALSS